MQQHVMHEKQARVSTRWVFFTPPTATASTFILRKGMGVCYDRDYSSATVSGDAATDPCGKRDRRVELPSATNNLRFAGVAIRDYLAKSGGQWIEIYEPGSVCEVSIGVDTVMPSGATQGTILTCSASTSDAGRFTFKGMSGRGTAIALETNASGNIFESIDGTATGALSGSTYTITKTGIGTACGYGSSTLTPTDYKVVVLGGADDTYGGDATSGEMAVVGEYNVLTAPTADTITIDVSGGTDPGDVDLTIYVKSKAEQLALCYLMDGPESGLQQFVSPQDAVAVASMIGGVTFVCGGYTMAADSTYTLADGVIDGVRKAFYCLGTLTTKDYVVTVTHGEQNDGATTLATLSFDAAGEGSVVEWLGSWGPSTAGKWCELFTTTSGVVG